MSKQAPPINIGDMPDLLRIVEDVARSGQSRLLRRDDEDLARLTPVRRQRRGKVSDADYEAALAAAGTLHDVDADRFLADNAESRSVSTRPHVQL